MPFETPGEESATSRSRAVRACAARAPLSMVGPLGALLLMGLGPPGGQDPGEVELAVPNDAPYRMLDGGPRVDIPFRMLRGDIVLDVEVNGHTLVLGLDNGSVWDQLLFYGSPRIDALELEYDGQVLVAGSGAGDPTPSETASGITLRLPGLEIHDQSAIVSPESSGLTAAFAGEDGIISGSLFNNFVVGIDFDRMRLTLCEHGAFEYGDEGEAFELIPLGHASYALACDVELSSGERLALEPCIDLGSISPLDLFVDGRHEIPVPEGAVHKVLGYGAQGEFSGYQGRVASLRVGDYELNEVVTSFVGIDQHPGNGRDGLLGLPVLRRFHLTFDYRGRRLFLEPNQRFESPF